jgi:VIT1/CCC1 family predicted Fe2+/Mn2+ transporter
MSDNPKLKKNGGPGTKTGNFLRKIAGVGGPLLKVVGSLTGLESITNIASMINSDEAMSAEQKDIALSLLEMDYDDLKQAREMQIKIATSVNSTKLAKNFIYYLTTGVFVFSVVVVLLLFFVSIPKENKDVVNFILGVIVGTGLTGVFNYFFGSSKGSKDKDDLLTALNK